MRNELDFNWQYKLKVKHHSELTNWLEPCYEEIAPELTRVTETLTYDVDIIDLEKC